MDLPRSDCLRKNLAKIVSYQLMIKTDLINNHVGLVVFPFVEQDCLHLHEEPSGVPDIRLLRVELKVVRAESREKSLFAVIRNAFHIEILRHDRARFETKINFDPLHHRREHFVQGYSSEPFWKPALGFCYSLALKKDV